MAPKYQMASIVLEIQASFYQLELQRYNHSGSYEHSRKKKKKKKKKKERKDKDIEDLAVFWQYV